MTVKTTEPVWGTPKNERFVGTNDNDFIGGNGGNDTIYGGFGDDTIIGGDDLDTPGYVGNDKLFGGAGNDLILGEGGADTLYGENGNDTLWGGNDDDLVYGQNGNDLLGGDAGNDTVIGGAGNDSVWGGDGDDFLSGGTGNDIIGGDVGNDTIVGGAGADKLYGGTGNDVIFIGREDAEVSGGEGDDTIVFLNKPKTLTIYLSEGSDTIDISLSGYNLSSAQKAILFLNPQVAENYEFANLKLVEDFDAKEDKLIQFSTPGSKGAKALVNGLYDGLLDRDADAGGMQAWLKQISKGASLEKVANGFIQSKEFQSLYGNLSNDEFVDLMYDNFLDRDADSTGFAQWMAKLDDGASRAEIAVGFLRSYEYQDTLIADYLSL